MLSKPLQRYNTRRIVMILCAVLVLLQLLANGLGMHFDHHHDQADASTQSVMVDFGSTVDSLHGCTGHSHCHGTLPTFILQNLPEMPVAVRVNASLAISVAAIPAAPFATPFKPPIA